MLGMNVGVVCKSQSPPSHTHPFLHLELNMHYDIAYVLLMLLLQHWQGCGQLWTGGRVEPPRKGEREREREREQDWYSLIPRLDVC